MLEADPAAGELGAEKADLAAGEFGLEEADLAARELGAVEPYNPAGEIGAVEVTAVEDHAGEVEVKAFPGPRRPPAQMVADQTDDGVPHLPVSPVGSPLGRFGIVARVRIVGQAQVAAQHIDAGLPVFAPVISQARHGIHPGQPDSCWLVTAQLPGCRGEPLIQGSGERGVQLLALRRKRLVQLLALRRKGLVQLLTLVLVGQARIPESKDRHCRGGSHTKEGRNSTNPGRFNGGGGVMSDEHIRDVPGQ